MNGREDTIPSDADRESPRGASWLRAFLVALVFFAAIAPTLPWLEFAGGSENLVAETVLEMRRGGPWFIPTLQGEPRLNKPPLTAWIAAAAVNPDTIGRLSSRDRAGRDAAFRRFAWELRWPALLSACAMLAATCALGDLLLGRPTGVVAALACGSSLMFLRFARSATTDVQLALWVTAANAFLALALLRGRYWLGFVGAGAALGLSLMSKGPVGLVQTVLPFGLFLLWRRTVGAAPRTPSANAVGPALAGIAIMLALALPWPLAVFAKHPDILHTWFREITREGATVLAPDPWYVYFVFPAWVVPWLSFFVAGLWLGSMSLFRPLAASHGNGDQRQGFVLALLLTIVPILTMSLFKDKNERYLLPMAAPAAVLAAGVTVAWFRSDRRDGGGRAVEVGHWVTLAVLALSPAAAAVFARTFGIPEGSFDLRWGLIGGAVALTLAWLTYVRYSRQAPNAVGVALMTGIMMLLLQYPFMIGYDRLSRSDLKPLADAVWAHYPDAVLYEYEPGTKTRTYLDLPIYAGRLTRKLHDPSSLAQADRPQVVVFFQRQGEPPALGPRWKELTTGGGRKDRWRAFVLPAAG